jgi:hypothetical protein
MNSDEFLDDVQQITAEQRVELTKTVHVKRRVRKPVPKVNGHISLSEAACFIGVSQKTLCRWHAGNYGPPRIVHKRHIFYDWKKLFAWLHGLQN